MPTSNDKKTIICEFCEKPYEVDSWELGYKKIIGHPECEEKIKKYTRIGIDKRFWNLPKFKIEKDNANAFKAVEKFIKNPGKTGLFLYGDAGSGKTHLAVKIAQEIGLNTKFVKTSKLLLEMKSNFDGKSWQNEAMVKKLSEIELLILDDLGAEKTTEWVAETFYLLIDERYGKMLPIIITSNLSLEEIEKRFGDRICSRITEMCQVIKIDSEDARIKKNKQISVAD